STAMWSTRQGIYKGLGTWPDAQALHGVRQKLFFQIATGPLKKLVDSGLIFVGQPALKRRHDAASIDSPVKTMDMYNHHFPALRLSNIYQYPAYNYRTNLLSVHPN